MDKKSARKTRTKKIKNEQSGRKKPRKESQSVMRKMNDHSDMPEEAPTQGMFTRDREKDKPQPMHMTNPTDTQKAAYEKFAKEVFATGTDGLAKEYMEQLKVYYGNRTARAIFDENGPKNRYKDVVCNDNTRVVLDDGRGSDYIHANYVRGEPLYNEFICTQGPMASTSVDFWRMVLHVKSYHIIMLCEVVEMGKTKCEQFWPTMKGEKMVFGDITVEHMDQSCKDGHVTKTQLQVTCGTQVHSVRHHQWKTWPDRSVPKSSKALLRILQAVRQSPRPVIVHCSAGIGRTGTLVAAEMCLQRLLTTNHLCLLDVSKRLRDQRMNSVQVELQYVYLAQVVLEYGKAMDFWNKDELKEEYAKFKGNLEFLLTKKDEPAPQPTPQASSLVPACSAAEPAK